MTLDEAIAAVQALFPNDDASDIAETLDITSGGLRIDRDIEPALYASRELAVTAWQRETIEILRERGAIACALKDGPHLDKWHITVMDSKGTQRTAEPRWSVTAKIGLILQPKESQT